MRIVLGVSGGIAAYKSVEVCRRLVEEGHTVIPVLTRAARRFVGPTTFSALASEPVPRGLWSGGIPHTRLGQGADLVLVAPATADLLARYAAGIADDLLTSTLLATRAQVIVCPAMHTEMWEHPAVEANLRVLRGRGVGVIGPERGRLAGGDEGAGRMADPATIVEGVRRAGARRADLAGWHVVVSAGGTKEPIDPVRVITNRSSGKQGHAVAEAALRRGARVTLVTASSLPPPAGARVVAVETASEMEQAVTAAAADADVVVMAAAIADFRPKAVSAEKLHGVPELVLEPTPDILAGLGARRRPGQVLVGFAAETGRDGGEPTLMSRAREKLARKGADMLVVNDVSAPGAGFEHDTNAVTIVESGRDTMEVPLRSKREVADAVLDAVVERRARGESTV